MKILVFGIGGIGGFVGGALARVHKETYFYARGKNLEAIRAHGLSVKSKMLGNFNVRPKLVSHDPAELGKMDVILLSCKGNGIKEACREMGPMIKSDTVVVPLLNGVLVSDLMEKWLPPCLLADGTIRVFSHLEGPGVVVQTAGFNQIVMGMKEGPAPEALKEAAVLLNESGIPTEVTDDIRLDSWAKYAMMGTNSCLFCYFDGPAGKVKSSPGFEEALHGAIREMISVAAAEGTKLPSDYEDWHVNFFKNIPDDTMTSLYRDLESGKKADDTEVHMILGRMVEMGRETGVPVPYFTKAYERALAKAAKNNP